MLNSNAAWPLPVDPILSPAAQVVVPVLGMHRSGTSLVTRLLDLLGMELGWPLISPYSDNPKGFWEHELFLNLNCQVLGKLGAHQAGYGTVQQIEAVARMAAAVDMTPDVMEVIEEKLSRGFMSPVWGFKDPRTSLLWPMWYKIFRQLGYQKFQPVIVVRQPSAVVQSILKRGDFSAFSDTPPEQLEAHIEGIWQGFYQAILNSNVVGMNPLVVCQEHLLDPVTAPIEVSRLAGVLGSGDTDIAAAMDWIDSTMDHRVSGGVAITSAALRLYEGLENEATRQREQFVGSGRYKAYFESPKVIQLNKSKPAKWSIYIVSPMNNPFSRCLNEVAETLQYAFAEHGVAVPIVTDPKEIEGTPIVLNPNYIDRFFDTMEVDLGLPSSSIMYNLEQVGSDSPWMTTRYADLLKRHRTWDYNEQNISRLAKIGVEVERVCPVGYAPVLERIPENHNKDIDVLFYGSIGARRGAVIDALIARGLRVIISTNLYGDSRDHLLSRAKVVLNVHHHVAKVLEMVRITYPLSNGCVVVSEPGSDLGLAEELKEAVIFANYDNIVETCVQVVQSPHVRAEYSKNAKAIMRSRPQSTFVGELLARANQ